MQFDDVGLDDMLRLEESTGVFASFEDEGEPCELGGARADLEPVQIVLQDQSGNLGGCVTLLFVDEGEQVEACVSAKLGFAK